MTSELKQCPFCLRQLKRSSGKFNPMAVCETDGCWMKEKQIAVPCDDPFSVKSWNTRAVPDVPELVRYSVRLDEGRYFGMAEYAGGKYVLHSQAAEIIAAEQQKTKDADELAFRMDRFAKKYLRHMRNAEQRAEAAEAKLAQYEAQEPVAWMHPYAGWSHVSKDEVAVHCKHGTHPKPLYDRPPPAADLKAVIVKEIEGYIDLYKNQEKVSRSHVLKGLSELRNRINKKGESNV